MEKLKLKLNEVNVEKLETKQLKKIFGGKGIYMHYRNDLTGTGISCSDASYACAKVNDDIRVWDKDK